MLFSWSLTAGFQFSWIESFESVTLPGFAGLTAGSLGSRERPALLCEKALTSNRSLRCRVVCALGQLDLVDDGVLQTRAFARLHVCLRVVQVRTAALCLDGCERVVLDLRLRQS